MPLRPVFLAAVLALFPVLIACNEPLEGTSDVPAAIPWRGVGVETHRYVIKDRDGDEAGTGTLTVREKDSTVELLQHYENADSTDDVKVLADAATLKPLETTRSSRSTDFQRDLVARYSEDRVEVVITGDDPQTKEIELPGHAYDAEESLFLWRTLPFAVGYRVKYVAINPNRPTGRVATTRVTGRERITVPAGAFETWRVETSAAGSRIVAWYDAAAPHPLVRYDIGEFVYELVE